MTTGFIYLISDYKVKRFLLRPSLKTDHSYNLSSASFITVLPSDGNITYIGEKALLNN
jgi:hypothetical protein